ncbi:hypothetical protein ACFLYU_05650 [Candidatus Dependentiae bacterium]
MRKSYLVLFILFFVSSSLFGAQCCHGDEFIEQCSDCNENNFYVSRTFMMTRPVSHNVRAEQSLWHDFLYSKRDKGGSFQITTFYQQSIKNPKTAKYFTFNYKTLLKVLGDDNHDSCFRDVRAEWLGLPSDFRGAFSIDPEQKQFACVLAYNQDLKSFVDYDFLKRFWLEISLPIAVVENNMNLCQCDIFNKSESFPRDIKEAFNNSDWRFARINGKISCLNLAPLRIRFGGAFMDDGNNQIVSYTGILLPTGREDCNKYLFEPVSDYNGHLGFGTGVNFQFVLNRDNDSCYDICFFLNLEALFLIRRWHCRTFDLKCMPTSGDCPSCNVTCAPCELQRRPWSRYLLFNTRNGVPDQNIPGVNVLTRKVKVRPYSMFDFSFGFRIKSERFELELGYGIWGHGTERIECIEKFKKQWGIAGIKQEGDTFARSASLSTIGQRIATDAENDADDPTFISICATDLDLDSAASQGALNHIINIAGGFENKGDAVDVFFGVGAYYEGPQKNSALETWGLWLKFGGSF